MFLFSTPPTRETQSANPVVDAIREGAQKTGAGFDYLLKTAQRESALEPDAKAKTSSATGLFQFIEQTWLSMVKQEGPKQGLGNLASAISTDDSGRLSVPDPAAREKILQLRNDPQVAALMAGAFTQKNRDQLASSLGRQPQAGELYMAHVLGARGASDLIRTAESDPARVAAKDFPDAAAANRGIFFDKAGRARSAQEVYGVLAASHANTQLAATTAANASAGNASAQGADQPVPIAAALAPGRAKGLIGLFSTEGSRAPVSPAVANLWTTPRASNSRLASLDPADRYFPRQTQNGAVPAAADAVAAKPASAATALPVSAPLPPTRPVDLTQPASVQARPAAKPRRAAPLDLSSFMVQRSGT
ncbi:lytic transglycosylase domain-containing protein [Bosea caraganae]|uniref:Lytic transglycosylase domain-containing protein n=1 Tax=Bosea caraganae TaxID=2763117 RepID=A0A370LD52_9HYPH|nr:transglycosylase SLT domain-containing protein [Bosea caraganae]RDJ27891.1 lytic transglycosylase domain-containing protein [Bosea caraganae]RDJ29904.1 lytic transglycosylase domain-containing protein [Bosea caraganae]